MASWQRWPGGLSLVQVVLSQPIAVGEAPAREPSPQRLGFVRVALSGRAAAADLERLRRGLLLGGIVTALAALLVGRRMLRAAFLPLQQQVDALQRFTADASHELRHPLTALRTLLAAVPADLRQHPGLAWPELDRLSRRMGELLEDLLTLARLQQSGDGGEARPLHWQRFDLLELLEDLIRCYASQAAAREITLLLSPAPEEHSVPVEGDSEELLRLFTNLLLNAIRHSPEAGSVNLEVTAASRCVRVAVCDQGPGIPMAQREQVFDRFWSGVDRGGQSGLGLAISRAIARRHGGELRLGESRPGRCVLLVELPAATDPPQTS
jgi:signal transduction histidine kinase